MRHVYYIKTSQGRFEYQKPVVNFNNKTEAIFGINKHQRKIHSTYTPHRLLFDKHNCLVTRYQILCKAMLQIRGCTTTAEYR